MGTNKGSRHIRLCEEAYSILNDHFDHVSQTPLEAARAELAEKVARLPGCEHYTPLHVYRYFANMRHKIRALEPHKAGRPPRIPNRTGKPGRPPKYPDPPRSESLALEQLEVLLREEPNPSAQVAEIWAERLDGGTTADQILTYAFIRRGSTAQQRDEQSPDTPLQQGSSAQPTSPQPVTVEWSDPKPSSLLSPRGNTTIGSGAMPSDDPAAQCAESSFEDPILDSTSPQPSQGSHVGASPEVLQCDAAGKSDAAVMLRQLEAFDVDPKALAAALHGALTQSGLLGRSQVSCAPSTPDRREGAVPKTFLELAHYLREHNERTGLVARASDAGEDGEHPVRHSK